MRYIMKLQRSQRQAKITIPMKLLRELDMFNDEYVEVRKISERELSVMRLELTPRNEGEEHV